MRPTMSTCDFFLCKHHQPQKWHVQLHSEEAWVWLYLVPVIKHNVTNSVTFHKKKHFYWTTTRTIVDKDGAHKYNDAGCSHYKHYFNTKSATLLKKF